MPESIKRKKKKNTFYPEMCFISVLLLIISLSFYGFRALLLFCVSVLSAIIFDFIACRIIRRKFKIKNCHSVFVGALIALMLPVSSPLWLPVAGCAFGIFAVRMPFGSITNAPFSSAAAGMAFLSICRPDLVFAYPAVTASGEFISGTSLAHSLSQGTPIVTAIDLINAFIGTVPGGMGMTCSVALLGALAFSLFRRPKSFINSLGFLIVCFLGAIIWTLIQGNNLLSENSLRVIFLKMCSGSTLFIATFFVSEECFSPKKNIHRIFYGITMGVIYMVLIQVSAYEDPGCFAVLITNAMWPVFEKYIFKSKSAKKEVIAHERQKSLT